MNTTIASLIPLYIDAATVEEGKSKKTIKQYQNRLRIFSRWMGEGATTEQITLPVAYDFLYWLSGKPKPVKLFSPMPSLSPKPRSSTTSMR